jgi:hypothetical protein
LLSTASALLRKLAGRGLLVRLKATRGIAADKLLTAGGRPEG